MEALPRRVAGLMPIRASTRPQAQAKRLLTQLGFAVPLQPLADAAQSSRSAITDGPARSSNAYLPGFLLAQRATTQSRSGAALSLRDCAAALAMTN